MPTTRNNRVIHFEIHATDPQELAKFYTDVFGWSVEEWKPPEGITLKDENRYWGVMSAPMDSKEPGINGGIVVRKGPKPTGNEPVSSFVSTIDVENVDKCLKKLRVPEEQLQFPKWQFLKWRGWLMPKTRTEIFLEFLSQTPKP